jgi:hypothetical protein
VLIIIIICIHFCFAHKIWIKEAYVSPMNELPQPIDFSMPSYPPKFESMVSLNVLNSFSIPQTLKLIGYIKNRKVIILVESGNTLNFIHRCIAQKINFYILAINNFQIMITNYSSMKCGGRCENVHLQISRYHLKYHMFSIDMGDCDIVLGME